MTPMRIAIPLVGLLMVAVPARATVLLDWTLEERVARADRVVVGTVISQRAVTEGELILTENTIRVERALYGKPGATLVISTLGGTIGEATMDVPGEAVLHTGERIVAIVKRNAKGRNHLVSMGMGAFTLRGEIARQTIEVPLLRGDGTMAEPPGLQITDLQRITRAIATVHR